MIPAVMPTYARYDVAFDHGEGAYLWDTEGRRYLDFGAGIAVACLGHAHPQLVDAIREQAGKLMHTSNLYHIPGQERLAERLVAHSFADAVFFNNSGGEAVEMCMKMIRKYHAEEGHPEKYRIITVEGAFHGRSLACIAAAKNEKYQKGFGPEVDGFDQVAFDNLNELKAAIGPETGGIMVEPVQGEGGIRPMSDDYLRSLRDIADEFGLLLAYDEVQCGAGRTGKLFAHEWSGAKPDVMASAKGLGGGFPMAATLATEKVAAAMHAGSHGTTYGGNPLAMAAGNAVLDVLTNDGFLNGVAQHGETLMSGIRDLIAKYPTVFESVRGRGLMIGIKCVAVNGDVVKAAMELGLLTVPAGDNVVRLVPPLVVGEEEIMTALSILDAVGKDFESKAA